MQYFDISIIDIPIGIEYSLLVAPFELSSKSLLFPEWTKAHEDDLRDYSPAPIAGR
jgi:hypothetical protein